MKKKNLKHNGLTLNKNIISSLKSSEINGGGTESCLADIDTACYTGACGTNNCGTNNCGTNNCGTNNCPPQTLDCPRSISCQPVGIC